MINAQFARNQASCCEEAYTQIASAIAQKEPERYQ